MPVATEYTDYRQKWLLHPGDAIQCNDTIYTISGPPLGFGGSAVLYPAAKNGSALFYAIKEGFPGGSEHFGRRNGIIQPLDPEDDFSFAQLEQYRSMLSKERELGQQIRNTSTRAIAIWDTLTPTAVTTGGETFTNVSNGIFSVLERMNGKGMFFNEFLEAIKNSYSPEDLRRTQGLPQIYTTSRIMEQVLLALHRVHQAGYLYGDCSPSNIFFSECDPKSGNAGIGHLIDFGSARELEEDGYTAPITKGEVFSTDGFRPFEIRDNKDGFLRFGKQADVYSAGCLMLRCVVSPQKLKTYGDSPCAGSNALSEVNGRAINCTGRVLQLLNAILDKATKYDPKDRYADAGEMLLDIQKLIEEIRPPKNKLGLGLSTLSDGEFLGRKDELHQIDLHLSQYRNPTIVYGFPGMGKTELVIEYGRRKMSTCQVHFVRFEQSFFKTIVDSISTAFSGYSRFLSNGQPKHEKRVYDEVMQMLCEQSSDDILIIDNVDSEIKDFSHLCDECYDALCRLPMHLIITTRTRCEGYGIEVDSLGKQLLRQLMARFTDLPTPQMDAIIDEVEEHTLTVELVARSLKYSIPRISPETMLEQLRKGETGVPMFARISINKDRDRKKRRIEDHLLVLFKLTDLPKDEIRYMYNAFCIPDKGMELELFSRACPEFDQDKLNHLLERGWIRLDEDSDMLSVHPLIRETTRKTFHLKYSDIREFVDRLSEYVQNHPKRVKQIVEVYHRINDCLALPQASIDRYKQQEYSWAFSEIRAILGKMPKGLLIEIPYDFCVIVSENCDKSYTPVWNEDDILNKNLFPLRMTEIILSIIYRDFLVSLEEHEKLIQRDQEELILTGESLDGSLKEIFTPFSITEAEQDGRGKYAEWLYLGKIYQTLGKLDRAATYLFMAWSTMDSLASFCDELPSHYHEEYVDTCLKLGNIYVEIKDYKAGFEFFTKCADAGSAIGINNLGWMYQHGYGCARDLLQAKALFEEATHHTNNPSKAACKHLGDLYLGLEDDPDGLIPLDPALAIHYYEKAKSLGHTSVDEKIARAKAMLESN